MNNLAKLTVYGLKSKESLRKGLALLAALLLCGLTATAQTSENVGYVIYTGSNYLDGTGNTQTPAGTTTFNPQTCIWNGNNGGTFSNGNGYYLRVYNSYLYTYNSNPTNCTISGTETGTTGQILRVGTGTYSYVTYSSDWDVARSGGTTALFAVTKYTYSGTSVNPTISGDAVISSTGTNNSFTKTSDASYTDSYLDYVFYNGAHHRFKSDNTTALANAPTAHSFNYSWSLSGISSSNATINQSTGVITYSNNVDNDVVATVTLTATSTSDATVVLTATQNVTFKDLRIEANPTAITANNVEVDKDATIAYTGYTLTVADPTTNRPHNYVSATSGNTSVATITNNSGSFTITGVAEGTATITISAYGTDNTTPACSTTFTVTVLNIQTGTTATVVTLNDYEDHSWSYYSDPSCPIHSLNPANVKITYYGNGKMYTSTTATPSGSLSNVSTVKVSNSEAQHTFVYYKTLERTDGSTSATPTGRCEYRAIPNPFTVRPTFTLSGTKYYTGFYKWRVKTLSGGAIYDASTGGNSIGVGSTVDADQMLYFAPSGEYGMTVEFEAVWARAYVTTGTTSLSSGSYVTGTNAYERNFHVLTGSTTASNLQKSYGLTISALYPDGSNGGGSLSGGFTAAANTKFENVTISASNGTYSANCHDLVIGRGCSGSTINIVQGLGDNQTSDVSYSIRLESGTIVSFWPTRKDATTFSGKLSTLSTIGCDYDRASGTNTLLHIMPNVSSGTNTYFIEGGGGTNVFNGSGNRNNITYDWIVKSGKIQENVSINTADPFYLGNYISNSNANGAQYLGKRRLTIEGGELGTVACGCDCYGNNYANYAVNDGSWTVKVRMTGGTINGSLYGAAVFTGANGGRLFILTNGTIKGWVAGGCNGSRTDGGELYGNTNLYVGGKMNLDGTASTTVGSSNGGHIFGAGSGISGGTTVGRVNSSTVVVADEAEIARNVYGGGNYGYVREGSGNKSDIYILGGTVKGSVFGGSNQQVGQIVNIKMTDGLVESGVYGGSNASGTVAGPVTIQVDGGTVGDGGSEDGVYGGGYGASTSVTGNVSVTLGESPATSGGATVDGNVYGGSALGSTNAGSNTNTTTVTLNRGTVTGDLFGGALGSGASINGKITVLVAGGSVNGSVYGGGDAAPYSPSSNHPAVTMSGGTVGNLFGGGKGPTAIVTGNPQVVLTGNAHVLGNVYGGGDAAEVRGTTSVKVQ